MISHQGIAFITHSVFLRINLTELTLLFTTVLTDSLTTSLAIMLEDHSDTPKGFTAEHAKARI